MKYSIVPENKQIVYQSSGLEKGVILWSILDQNSKKVLTDFRSFSDLCAEGQRAFSHLLLEVLVKFFILSKIVLVPRHPFPHKRGDTVVHDPGRQRVSLAIGFCFITLKEVWQMISFRTSSGVSFQELEYLLTFPLWVFLHLLVKKVENAVLVFSSHHPFTCSCQELTALLLCLNIVVPWTRVRYHCIH